MDDRTGTMGTERFDIVDRLYRAALQVEPDHRSVFLKEACGGDEILRKDVEFLLELDEKTAAFVNRPTSDIFAELVAQEMDVPAFAETARTRRFLPAEIIADRFEIVALIGQGGMGDVYEAKDLHLGEHVALKTIRPEFASDQRMLGKFKQEILLAKKVTHLNVCRIMT